MPAMSGSIRKRGWPSDIGGSRSSTCRRPEHSRWSRRAAALSFPITARSTTPTNCVPELEAAGRRFRGHSDTEVIVEGAAVWGVEATVKRLIGMFAMAVWDRRERTLYLVRDRLGIKPLYWAEFDGRLLFGSELKALRADRAGRRSSIATRCCRSCASAMCRRRIRSIAAFTNCRPGRFCGLRPAARRVVTPYWSLQEIARRGQSEPVRAAARTRPPRRSMRCCATRSGAAWSPTCRSAPFCRAASIHRRSSR